MPVKANFDTLKVRQRVEPYLVKLASQYLFTKETLFPKLETSPENHFEVSTEQVFLQNLRLPQSSLAAARKAVSLQMERLSPLSTSKIGWSLEALPTTDLNISPNGLTSFRLAIIRNDVLDRLIPIDVPIATADLMATDHLQSTGEFRFYRREGLLQLGRKIAFTVLCTGLLYASILWALSSWTSRLTEENNHLTHLSHELRETIQDDQETIRELEIKDEILREIIANESTRTILNQLAQTSATLIETDRFLKFQALQTETYLTLLTEDPDRNLESIRTALPKSSVEISQVSTGETSPYRRTVIRVISPKGATNPTKETP